MRVMSSFCWRGDPEVSLPADSECVLVRTCGREKGVFTDRVTEHQSGDDDAAKDSLKTTIVG
jgi:hypothetical protein